MEHVPQHLVDIHGDAVETVGHAIPMAARLKFGKAVLVIAAADGVLSDTERNYFLDTARSYGASDSVLEECKKFDPKSVKLDDLLDPEYKQLARHFVYDAIRVSAADGYHEKEAAAVRKAAKILGVDDWAVTAIEALIGAEDGLRKARLSLLSPPKAR